MLPLLTCRTKSVTWTHILTLDTARGQKGGSIPPLVRRPAPSGDYIGPTEVRQRMKMGSKCATHTEYITARVARYDTSKMQNVG